VNEKVISPTETFTNKTIKVNTLTFIKITDFTEFDFILSELFHGRRPISGKKITAVKS